MNGTHLTSFSGTCITHTRYRQTFNQAVHDEYIFYANITYVYGLVCVCVYNVHTKQCCKHSNREPHVSKTFQSLTDTNVCQ